MPVHTAPQPPRLIDLPEVTRLTTLRKTAVYELIKAGELRPIKLGRKTVFAEAEVANWVRTKIGQPADASAELAGV
jgi:excisionase family DNA binding protein